MTADKLMITLSPTKNTMKLLKFYLNIFSQIQPSQKFHNYCQKKPQHLICFKQWTAEMVMEIVRSAINLKCSVGDTHSKRMGVLTNSKVMILQELNEPILNMAVSKAATFLGAYDVNIIDHLVWENDYIGKVFSLMADVIFVATSTHMCVQRFANQSTVPVLCMRSRTHASIQSLATIMAIVEEFGTMENVKVAYVGHAHPVLNSYLLLCPMLGAHIRFLCCCKKEAAISPLLFKASTDLTSQTHTESKECMDKAQVLTNASVIISGPTSHDTEELKAFKITELIGQTTQLQQVQQLKVPLMTRRSVKSRLPSTLEPLPSTNRVTPPSAESTAIRLPARRLLCWSCNSSPDSSLVHQDIRKNTSNYWIYFHTCPRGAEVEDSLFNHWNSRVTNSFHNMQYIAAALMANAVKGYQF